MKKVLLTFALVFITMFAYSQAWMQFLPQNKKEADLTFFEYQAAFNTWCLEKGIDKEGYYINDNGVKQKAGGWKGFKRWENEMRMMGNYDPQTGEFIHQKAMYDLIFEEIRNQSNGDRNLSGNWVNLGYTNLPGNGGYIGIGRINTLAFHPTDPDKFWIGAPRGGIWVTEDAGDSWTPLSDNIGHIGVSAIGIPADYDVSNTIYIGTGDRSRLDDRGIGILKSIDGGSTWQETCRTVEVGEFYVNRILISPPDQLLQLAGTSQGIFLTTDGWESDVKVSSARVIDMEFHPASSGIVYASTRNVGGNTLVLRSEDAGSSWDTVLVCPGLRTEIAVSPDEPDWLYAIVSNNDEGLYGIYVSVDAGETFVLQWDGMQSSHNLLGYDCMGLDIGGQGVYDLAIAVNPMNASDVWIGGINLWRSTTAGTSWEIKSHWATPCFGVPIIHADQHWLAFQHDTETLFACNDGGIYRMEYIPFIGPGVWIDISDGLTINQIYYLSNSQQDFDEIIIGLQDNSVILWTDGDLESFECGDGMDVLINPEDDNIQYYTGNHTYPVGTLDHWGMSYFSFSVSGDASDDWSKCFRIDPSNMNIVYYGLTKLWKSTNFGMDFSLLFDPPDPGAIRQIAIAPSDPDVIYFSNDDNIYKTEDGGNSWLPLTSNLPAEVSTTHISEIVIKNDNPEVVWLSFGGWGNVHILKSSNGGISWTDITQGMIPAPCFDLIQDHSVTAYPVLYAAGFYGVYVKLGDQDWIPFDSGLPNLTVRDLDIYYAGNKLRAGTWGRGFWESELFSPETGMTGIWTGVYSTNWNDYRNWQYMEVPGAGSNVVIPSNCIRNPHVYTGSAICAGLILEDSATLNISGYELVVNGDAILNGSLKMHATNSKLTVQGDISWEEGSLFTLTGTNGLFDISGNWTFKSDAAIDLSGTEVRFLGNVTSNLYYYSPDCYFGKLKVDKTAPASLYYNGQSTADLMVKGRMTVTPTGKYYQHSDRILKVWGSLDAQGSFFQQNGTFVCNDSDTLTLASPASFFNNLTIENSSLVTLASDIEVRENLDIKSGALRVLEYNLGLGGDINKAASGVISMTTGKLVFNGSDEQKILNDIVIKSVEINKPSDTLRVTVGRTVEIDYLDWTNGSLTLEASADLSVDDLIDNGIYGTYRVKYNSVLNLSNPDASVDLNAKLFISAGTVNVYGGTHASYWPDAASAELHMSSGTIDFKNVGIYVRYHPTNTFTENITGGVIRTASSFAGDHTAFNPAGGTIELYGPNNAEIGHAAGSNFHKVVINKESGSNTVSVLDNLDINDQLVITSGVLNINGKTVDVASLLNIYGTLTMTNPASVLNVGSGVDWFSGSSSNITEGLITFKTSWQFGNGTNAMFSGNNTVKATGDGVCDIYHKDPDASFANFIADKSSGALYLDNTSSYPMRVNGNMTVKNGNSLRVSTSDLVVNGTFLAENTASVIIHDGGAIESNSSTFRNTFNLVNGSMLTTNGLQVEGTLNLTDGGSVIANNFNLIGTLNIHAGSVLVHNNYGQFDTGHLFIDGGSFIIDKPYSGVLFGFGGTTDLFGGLFEISYDGIKFEPEAIVNIYGGNLRVGGNFQAVEPNSFQPDYGAIEFINTAGSVIECNNGNYFHDLIINKSAGASACSLAFATTVNNNLTIQSGQLNTGNNSLTVNKNLAIQSDGVLSAGSSGIYVGDDWMNYRGTEGFLEGTSTVYLVSPQTSTLSSETFYRLEVNKTTGFMQFVDMASGSTLNINNKLTLTDGTLRINDNCTLNLIGDLHIKYAAGLYANAAATGTVVNTYSGWLDENTTASVMVGFMAGQSTVNFKGSEVQVLTALGGAAFYNLNLQKTAEGFRPNNNITVNSNYTQTGGTWIQNASGLTYTFKGNYTISDPSLWLDDVNTMVFSGTADQFLTSISQGWLNFGILETNKPVNSLLYIIADIGCANRFIVTSGVAQIEDQRLLCRNGLEIYSGGDIFLLGDMTVYMGSDASVRVDGGNLTVFGNSGDKANITRVDNGYYEFTVDNGGSITAVYTDFEYINSRGLQIYPDGIISGALPFNYCTFKQGEAGGTLLQINNNQDITLYNVNFPANTWSGASNVKKQNNAGNVVMASATGSFAGPQFENDVYNRIQWPSAGIWDGDVSTDWHDYRNWWYDYQCPDGGTDVIIPAGVPNYPILTQSEVYVNSLKVLNNSSLRIYKDSLFVNSWVDNYGEIALGNADGNVIGLFCDSIVWQTGSLASLTDRGTFYISGNMFIRRGSNLSDINGTWQFEGNEDSRLICHDTATINSLYNYKNAGYSLKLSGDTIAQLTVNGTFINGPGATLKCPSTQEWVFNGNFRNTDNGYLRCENGTIKLRGSITSSYFRLKPGDYLNHLTIESLTRLNLYTTTGFSDTIRINGNLCINPRTGGTSGITANAFKILVWGDWINNAGTTALNAGTSKVVFMNASNPQNVSGNTIFNNLTAGWFEGSEVSFNGQNTVNNVLESMYTTNVYGTLNAGSAYSDNDFAALNLHEGSYMQINTFYQGALVYVNGGTLMVTDLGEDHLKSSYIIDDGLISLGQVYSPNASHDLYYASLTINGGELRFTGGNGLSHWPRSPGTASVTMTGGVFDLTNQEVFIKPTGFTENISGGKIRSTLSFSADPAATNFHPSGGTIELYGTEDCSFSMPEPSCWFYDLHLSKTEGGGAYPSSNMRIKNEFRVKSGYVATDIYQITVGP